MNTNDIFKGGVLVRNPERMGEALKRYYEFMINLNSEYRSNNGKNKLS
ncbi:hypothetical protein [Clostridium butyricum]|nr:hypothetical protein [Clostridium butyricum]